MDALNNYIETKKKSTLRFSVDCKYFPEHNEVNLVLT